MKGTELPDFENPPVVEVALGVQFETLSALRTPQLGLLWSKFRDRFPITEEHAPLDPVFERFGGVSAQASGVQIQMMRQLPVPRCWFLSQDGTQLIQIQQDRFVHNWRKSGSKDVYPRFEKTLRPNFEREIEQFQEFLRDEKIGKFDPNQCEVTYVNHIFGEDVWSKHHEINSVLALFAGQHSDKFLPEEEEVRGSGSYMISNEVGSPLGRLRFTIEPAFRRADQEPMFLLTLIARGQPMGEGVDGVMRFFDLGREWVVRGFASLTTEAMHKVWGRKQ